jgi:hypothetical protein
MEEGDDGSAAEVVVEVRFWDSGLGAILWSLMVEVLNLLILSRF